MTAIGFALALAPAGIAAQSSAFEAEALLRPAKAALEVQRDGQGRIALVEVLARFQEVTDWNLLISDETASLAERTHLYASGPLRAEPDAVLRVVEAVLASANYALALVRAEPPKLLSVRSLDTTYRTITRQDAILVAAADLPRFADHSGVLFETVASFPSLDVRTVSNSMRGFVVDPNLLLILPLGSTNEILLQGLGSSLADVWSLLGEIERHSASEGKGGAPVHRPPLTRRATKDVTLPGGAEHGLTLLDLVMTYGEATGDLALVDQASDGLLRAIALELEASRTILAADFPTHVEQLLLEHGFVVVDLLPGKPGLFEVQVLEDPESSSVRRNAHFVDEGSLELCSRRPATMFQSVVRLKHADARSVSNSLRASIDPKRLQIVPVGNTCSLIVQGVGAELAKLPEVLKTLDTPDAAQTAPVVPKAPEEGGK